MRPRFERRAATRIGLPVLLALVLAALPTLISGPPAPTVHDEFGYLLAADTFCEGRLTNATHPHWKHFETFHQLQRPTYQTKYPPAQGLALALGQALWHPIAGVWLGALSMVAAIVWMLGGYLPRRWSLVGGLLVAVQFVAVGRASSHSMIGYWSQSYWGGALAATGGALVFGALPRILRAPRVTTSLALAIGLALLANTRPKEGLIAVLPTAIVLAVWLARRRGPAVRVALRRTVLPVAAVLVVTGAGMGVYNQRVTGDAMRLPWVEHYDQYSAFGVFVWEAPCAGVTWNNEQLAAFHGRTEPELISRHHSVRGFARATLGKLGHEVRFYLGPLLAVALLMLPAVLRRRWMRFAALTCGLLVVNDLVTFTAVAHYSAPMAAWIALLAVQGLRYLRQVRVGGRRVGRVVFAAVLLGVALQGAWSVPRASREISWRKHTRVAVREEITRSGGEHLVLVRYGPRHNTHDEWVFNRASIDDAEVVWARSLSEAEDAALIEYFAERDVWQLDVGFGKGPPRPRMR